MKFVALRTKTRRSPHGTIKTLLDQTSRSIYRSRIDRGLAISLKLVTRRESGFEPDVTTSPLENEVLIAGMKVLVNKLGCRHCTIASKGASAVKILVDDLISTREASSDGLSRKLSTKDQAGHLDVTSWMLNSP